MGAAAVPDETDDQILARYRLRHPGITMRQALGLNQLARRYAGLLAEAQRVALLRREAEREEWRRAAFDPE